VYTANNRGGLAISRGAGDLLLKQGNLVILKPDLVEHRVKESSVGVVVSLLFSNDKSLLIHTGKIASDGLWDVYSNDEVALLIGGLLEEGVDAKEICTRLVAKACKKTAQTYTDNITIIFVLIRPISTSD
jgi:serine/threonine protein phosphatase PrpC